MRVRWQPTDPVYEDAQKQYAEFKSAQLKQAMWASVVRRRFLLQMKAKYAGMHTNVTTILLSTCSYFTHYRWAKDRKEAVSSNY